MTPFSFPLDRQHVPDPEIADHADAFASILRTAAKQISHGRSAEDVANELLPIVRVAARRV